MDLLVSKLSTSAEWEKLARRFFGRWGDRGFGNLSQSKLEALLVYCLHTHGIIPDDGVRISLAKANALGKEPAELDRLIAKGYTLFHDEPASSEILLETALRCLVSSEERIISGRLEFHCLSLLDKRFVSEFFERCGINPEHGRNSKILLVDLASIDRSRINATAIFDGLCAQLQIQPPQPSAVSSETGGSWLVRCLQDSRQELVKIGITDVARELLSRFLHGH